MSNSDPGFALAQTTADTQPVSPLASASGANVRSSIAITATLAMSPSQAPTPDPGPSPGPSGPTERPRRIGRYLVLREVGKGGMGMVYAGYDEELDRKVAIKLLHPAQQGDSQSRARIIREAQSLARVSAPNVVHVYEVGEFSGQLYIIMEFVNGTTLTRWQSEHGRSAKEILRMYCAAGQGLLDAHEAGLIHRDFKPDNVLLGKDGRPRVADFGLARMQQPAGSLGVNDVTAKYRAMNQLASSNPELSSLTQTGMLMGTPLYMSPEQHLGEPADSRSDQFSFCVALYEALYKQLPYEGSTLQALAVNTVKGKIRPRPTGSNVPAPVHEALLRGLSKTPDQRFPSMRELLAALAFDPTKDLAAAPRIRRALAVVVPAFFALEFVVQKLLRLEGVNEVSSSLVLSGALSLFTVLILLRLRRVVKSNAFHRGMLMLALGFTGQLFCFRVIGILLGLSLPQIMTFDLISVLVMTGLAAALFLPRLAILAPLAAVAALWAARHPEHAQRLSLVFVPTAMVVAMLLWSNAAKLRIPTNKDKDKPPPL